MSIRKKQKTLRPTANRVREALFDILRGEIQNALFLDLYAGTGAVGIDALREGAAEVVFVEESKSSFKKIIDLVEKKNFYEKVRVVNKKVLSFIEWAKLNSVVLDIIFRDPPYHSDEILKAMSAVGKSQILDQNGTVIAEHFSKIILPDCFDTLHKVKDYVYGDTVLSMYRREIETHNVSNL